MFNTPQALHDIYTSPGVTKGKGYLHLHNEGTPNILSALDRELHRKKRAVIAPILSDRSMRVFEPEMVRQIDTFLRELLRSSRRCETVDMSKRCERLGIDIVGQLSFGYDLNTQTDPANRTIIEGIKMRSRRRTQYFWWDKLGVFDKLFVLAQLVRHYAAFKAVLSSIRTMIDARMTLPRDAKHDFWAMASPALMTDPTRAWPPRTSGPRPSSSSPPGAPPRPRP